MQTIFSTVKLPKPEMVAFYTSLVQQSRFGPFHVNEFVARYFLAFYTISDETVWSVPGAKPPQKAVEEDKLIYEALRKQGRVCGNDLIGSQDDIMAAKRAVRAK